MSNEIEKRVVIASGLEVRAQDDGKKTLRGYAATFNSLSENLGGFREKIDPGAFADSIVDGARFLHHSLAAHFATV